MRQEIAHIWNENSPVRRMKTRSCFTLSHIRHYLPHLRTGGVQFHHRRMGINKNMVHSRVSITRYPLGIANAELVDHIDVFLNAKD